MSEIQDQVASGDTVDQAVALGGAYEVLRRRLGEQGQQLQAAAEALNQQRLAEFGDSRMAVLGRFRIRSENNAVGRDVVQVGNDCLLFGYNVYIGLKSQTRVEDVFSLYRLVQGADGYDVTPVDPAGSFLGQPEFVRDFTDLYAYYKHARLLQLIVRDGRLLAAFQIGERSTDVRVFRWSLAPDGRLEYLDSRGERDIVLPPPFDFEWTRAGREMMVNGRHPHLNILDTLFVETLGGDLTIKVENNTDTGQGIYSEPVEDATQSLDDAQIEFARLGTLILLRVLPYRETQWRGLIYNRLTGQVLRNDAIVQACVQLPEDHGVIFPGGCYLQSGEHRQFEAGLDGMQFKRCIRSPNGEDVLYIFYDREQGRSALLVYNTIARSLQNPVIGHGYALLADGRLVLFHAEGDAPTRIHPMQVWQTPFYSDEHAASRPASNTFLGAIGNAELVRGISNLLSVARSIASPEVSLPRYQRLVAQARSLFDSHHWLDSPHCGDMSKLLHAISSTGEAVLDEFEKVQSIAAQSAQGMAQAGHDHRALMARLQPENWQQVDEFVQALNAISQQRGQLLGIRELRYIDTAAIDAMLATLQQAGEQVGAATGRFLASDSALQPFNQRLQQLDEAAQAAGSAREIAEQLAQMQAMAADLDMLGELMASLHIDDASLHTRVVESISALYARLNQARARAEQRRRSAGSAENIARFSAQFALLEQAMASALVQATDPERADEQLSRLLVQLEELEGRFGEHEQFLADIVDKRQELLEAFDSHKQSLLDQRQRKARAVLEAADRLLEGLPRRAERFEHAEALHAFFAGDPLVLKLHELSERLRQYHDNVKADDIQARLKAIADQAVRALRDRSELYEAGGNVIKLGPRHRFSVNSQALDLTLVPHGQQLAVHLTGTDYLQVIQDPELEQGRAYWQLSLDSESPVLYRGEYLAGSIWLAARAGSDGLDMPRLQQAAADPAQLQQLVRDFAAPRYRQGYERGIHDHDAQRILQALLPLQQGAGVLIHPPSIRALAVQFWASQAGAAEVADWAQRKAGADVLQRLFADDSAQRLLEQEISACIEAHGHSAGLAWQPQQCAQAAAYLAEELAAGQPVFAFSCQARSLLEQLRSQLQAAGEHPRFEQLLAAASSESARWTLVTQWLAALCRQPQLQALERHVEEAAALLLHGPALHHRISEAGLSLTVSGLLGEHPRIVDGNLDVALDDFLARMQQHVQQFQPGFAAYQQVRNRIIQREREQLRLEEFKPRPLSSFVRNRLINEVYLGLIGDNLAKQMGTLGQGKRSDLMGLLMLISPPGYGKTTLMEYVASRLGLVFMKINGPSLGHQVTSLDPAQAPDATARQELEKINLALEMGSNTMLYVDDIQHTHPEFLQKFISLCDGTRRIEGVWRGRSRTYDLRGKKFCVVMAGNPYTESGEVFKIPDMLANRADIYNLGDVLGGMEEAFKLSYIENSLTSNPVLAPLATRDMADLYRLVDMAQGREVSSNDLGHGYSQAEINEIVATLQRLLQVREVVYRVNLQYIASAAQDDRYRTEPAFRLQGSYRNMNKLAEKVSPVMNAQELEQLLDDHYQGESQLLTTGAEENLLKLAELRGRLEPAQQARWEQIKRDFLRNKAIGGDDADVGGRIVAQLADIAAGLQHRTEPAPATATPAAAAPPWDELLQALQALSPPSPGAQLPGSAVSVEQLSPLLQALRENQLQQLQASRALTELASRLGQHRGDAAPAPAATAAPRPRNSATRRIDTALNQHFYGELPPEPGGALE